MRSAAKSLEGQPQAAGVASGATKTALSLSRLPRLDISVDLVEPMEVDEALQRSRHHRADLLLGEAAAGGLRWRARTARVRPGRGQKPCSNTGSGLGVSGEGVPMGTSRRASMMSQREEPSQNSMTIHSSGPRWKEP